MIGATGELATGLSAVLVGLPVFLFHWLTCQRDAQHDEDEHTSRIRVVFLYGIRAALLVPILYSTLAILDRGLAGLFGLNPNQAAFGGTQSLTDNLVAIMILLVAYLFFTRVLSQDEVTAAADSLLPETRRLPLSSESRIGY